MGKKLLQKKAFSLFEMLIAVAILVVLFAISMPAVSGISKKFSMKEKDNYAQTIYLEAQNQLLEKKAEGSLPMFYDQVLTFCENKYLTTPPPDLAAGADWGSLYYISTEDAAKLGILPGGAAYDGDYVIELNPATGEVYGVFYFDKKSGSGDAAGQFYVNTIQDLDGRDYASRAAVGLGYYGGGELQEEVEEVVQDVTSLDQNIEVINAEELYIKISYKLSIGLAAAIHASPDDLDIKMTLEGKESGVVTKLPVDKDNRKVIGNRLEVYVLLDSMLPGLSFKDIVATGEIIESGEGGFTTLIPGENVEVTVKTTFHQGDLFQSEDESVAVNSLFARKTMKNGMAEIEVKNFRHLRNLDETSYTHTGSAEPLVLLKNDIDFGDLKFNWYRTEEQSDENPMETVVKSHFAPNSSRPDHLTAFAPLNNNSVFGNEGAIFDGGNNALFNFVIDTAVHPATEGVGIFKELSGITVSDLKLVDISVKADGDDGATHVGALAGKINDCYIKNCGVFLSSKNASKTSYSLLPATKEGYANAMEERVDQYMISGLNFTGGLCGAAEDTNFEDCYSAIRVNGFGNVGGLCGSLTGRLTGEGATTSKVTDSYSSGTIRAKSPVGGLVGTSDTVTYTNCYSTSEIIANQQAGGIVGESVNGRYKNTISYAVLKDATTESSVPANSGVFVGGDAWDSDAFDGCMLLRQSEYNIGLKDAAGIVPNTYSGLKDPSSGGVSYPYSADLNKVAFPFKMVTDQKHHYGDWVKQAVISTSLAYYEQYEDGTYGYYSITKFAEIDKEKEMLTWVLDTLADDKICIDDGYALLTTYKLQSFEYMLQKGCEGAYTAPVELTIVKDTDDDEDEENEYEMATAGGSATEAILLRQQGRLKFNGYIGTTNAYSAETDFSLYEDKLVDTYEIGGMYLYQLPYELQTTDRWNVKYFYDKLIVYNALAKGNDAYPVIGTPDYNPNAEDSDDNSAITFYYCPHFARTAINPGFLVPSMMRPGDKGIYNPKKVYVRSAKQLNALGRNNYYWNTIGGNGYVNESTGAKMTIDFVQELDISFSAYTKTYCGKAFNLMDTSESNPVRNLTIGMSTDPRYAEYRGEGESPERQFNNNYDGGYHRIIDFRLETTERFAGLFGEVEGGTIQNVNMTVSQPYDPNDTANPYSYGGYIYSHYNGEMDSQPWWDLLDETNNRNVKTVAIGGLVGLNYETGNVITNCSVSGYDIRYVSPAEDVVVSGICVGGLAGISMSPIDHCSAVCDIKVELNGFYEYSISIGGLLGSSYYSPVRNCYSGGTIDFAVSNPSNIPYIAALGIGGLSGGVLKTWNEVTAKGNTSYENVYSYTKILVNKDDYASVGSRIKTDGWLNWIASIIDQWGTKRGDKDGLFISPLVVKNVLYNPYLLEIQVDWLLIIPLVSFVEHDFGVSLSSNDIKMNAANCFYLDYTSVELREHYNERHNTYTHHHSTSDGVSPKSHVDLANWAISNHRSVLTANSFPLADELQGACYDFPGVVTDKDGYYVHYGDWPEALTGTTFIKNYPAYYEKYTDGSYRYHYFDENLVLRGQLRNDIAVAEAKYVELRYNEGSIGGIDINGATYYQHDIAQSNVTPNNDSNSKTYTWNYTKLFVPETGAPIANGTGSVTLYVNGNFGDAISTSNNLGKNAENAYQIRTAQQFANIAGKTFSTAYFKQTTSFDMGSVTTSASLRSGWVYDGGRTGGFKINGAKTALFDTNYGTIQNVHSYGSSAVFLNTNYNNVKDCLVEGAAVTAGNSAVFVKTNATEDGGWFGTDYYGTIDNCHVTNSSIAANDSVAGFAYTNNYNITNSSVTRLEARSNGGGAAVGFVHTNNEDITNCSVLGLTAYAQNGFASGFVYDNKDTIENCKVYSDGVAKVSITGQSAAGFANSNTATIRNCGVYAEKSYEDTAITATTAEAYGFVKTNNEVINKCYVAGNISGPTTAVGFVGTNTDSGASVTECYVNGNINSLNGNAYGFVDSNQRAIQSCYCAGTVSAGAQIYGFGRITTKSSNASIKECYMICKLQGGNSGTAIYAFTTKKVDTNWWESSDNSSVSDCYWGYSNSQNFNNSNKIKNEREGCNQWTLQQMYDYAAGNGTLGALSNDEATADYPYSDALKTEGLETGDYPCLTISGVPHYGNWPTP